MAAVAALVMTAGTGAWAGGQNDAGCGVGSLIFKENSALPQILAATTNGTLGNQTFGITSGTLGCSASGSAKGAQLEQKQKDFVVSNFREINRQIAAGGGEYVASLSSLLGCSETATADFAKFAQSKYGSLFPSKDTAPNAMLKTLRSEMASDPKLASSCTLL